MMTVLAFLACACSGSDAPPEARETAASTTVETETEIETEAATKGITARAYLGEALAEARRWQADVELVGVSTSLAEGPTHSYWAYDVQSPSKSLCNRILAFTGGRVQNTGSEAECGLMKPLAVEFVDSPAAWDAARAAGFEPGESVQLGLRFQRDQALPEPRQCWVLWSDADGDEAKGTIRGWCVDAATGVFVARLSGYGRTEPRD
jgi:hypothetical protein